MQPKKIKFFLGNDWVYIGKGTTTNEGFKERGIHEIIWDPKNLSSEVYLYSINAKSADGKQSFRKTQKLLLMK